MGGQRNAPVPLPRQRESVPILQEAGCALGPVWTGVKNLVPAEIRSPGRPAHSESLYSVHFWLSVKENLYLK